MFCCFVIFFFFFFAYNQGRIFGCKGFVGFVYSQSGYMAIWWFLFRSNIEWPFVLQFSSSPFDFLFASLLMGALVGEVDFGDLEANLFFTVRLLQWGRFC